MRRKIRKEKSEGDKMKDENKGRQGEEKKDEKRTKRRRGDET
jgi:hypothetical protein